MSYWVWIGCMIVMHQLIVGPEWSSFSFRMRLFLNGRVVVLEFNGKFISCLKAWKIIAKGCIYHLVRFRDENSETPSIESVLLVNEFTDVFPEDLSGNPPEREIVF